MNDRARQQLWHAVQRLQLAADLCRDEADIDAASDCAKLQAHAERLMVRLERFDHVGTN